MSRIVESRLKQAQQNGKPYIMFNHGSSTSQNGTMTARSVVRGFMRSTAATPLIEKTHCIQHATVFVAKVRLHSTVIPNCESAIR